MKGNLRFGVQLSGVHSGREVTSNREVRGSKPGHGRNLVRDFCSTCAPWQTQLWWVHRPYTVSEKM